MVAKLRTSSILGMFQVKLGVNRSQGLENEMKVGFKLAPSG